MRNINLKNININFLPSSLQDSLKVFLKHENNPNCKASVYNKAKDKFDGELSNVRNAVLTEIYAGLKDLIIRQIELNEYDMPENALCGFSFEVTGLGRCKMTLQADGRCEVSKEDGRGLYGVIVHACEFYNFEQEVIGKYMVDAAKKIIAQVQAYQQGVNLQ